jgi:hypothetical protein
MNVKVGLSPNASKKNKHCFLIEIHKNHTIWYLAKRFSQILELKNELEKAHTMKIYDFPNKLVFNSYSNRVLEERIAIFNRFFLFINNRDSLSKDPFYERFIRTDITLDSVKNIQETHELSSCILKSESLDLKLDSLKINIDREKAEFLELSNKLEIIDKNIIETIKENKEITNHLLEINENRIDSHEDKLKLIEKMKELDNLYNVLRLNCCLIKSNKIDTIDKINSYTQKIELLKETITKLNEKISNIDDSYINKYWKKKEYNLINDLISLKIITNLIDINKQL